MKVLLKALGGKDSFKTINQKKAIGQSCLQREKAVLGGSHRHHFLGAMFSATGQMVPFFLFGSKKHLFYSCGQGKFHTPVDVGRAFHDRLWKDHDFWNENGFKRQN